MRKGVGLQVYFEGMGGVSDVIIQCGSVKGGERKERIESVEEKCGESIRCGDGKPEV